LTTILDAWPSLPEPIRAAVLTLVKAAALGAVSGPSDRPN
jgi:hypothetical protein